MPSKPKHSHTSVSELGGGAYRTVRQAAPTLWRRWPAIFHGARPQHCSLAQDTYLQWRLLPALMPVVACSHRVIFTVAQVFKEHLHKNLRNRKLRHACSTLKLPLSSPKTAVNTCQFLHRYNWNRFTCLILNLRDDSLQKQYLAMRLNRRPF